MTWLKQIDPVWKAAGTLLGVAVATLTFSGWLGVPAQVERHGAAIDTLRRSDRQIRSMVETQNDRWDRILCHLEQQRRENPTWEQCEG